MPVIVFLFSVSSVPSQAASRYFCNKKTLRTFMLFFFYGIVERVPLRLTVATSGK